MWDGVESFDAAYDGGDDWQIDSAGSDAATMTLNKQPTFVSLGNKSIRVQYDPGKGHGQAIIKRININETWEEVEGNRDHVRLEFDLYNPTSEPISVSVELMTGSAGATYESIPFNVAAKGWTTIPLNAQFPYWNCEPDSCQNANTVQGLDDVRQFRVIFTNYSGAGEIYIDYVRHQGDDSLVILPDELLFEVIKSEAERWKLDCYYRVYLPFILQP